MHLNWLHLAGWPTSSKDCQRKFASWPQLYPCGSECPLMSCGAPGIQPHSCETIALQQSCHCQSFSAWCANFTLSVTSQELWVRVICPPSKAHDSYLASHFVFFGIHFHLYLSCFHLSRWYEKYAKLVVLKSLASPGRLCHQAVHSLMCWQPCLRSTQVQPLIKECSRLTAS